MRPLPPPPQRPAPLAGSRAQGVRWLDPWGRGAARRRPEGKASRAHGDFPRPPRSCLHPRPEQQRGWGTGPWAPERLWGLLGKWPPAPWWWLCR